MISLRTLHAISLLFHQTTPKMERLSVTGVKIAAVVVLLSFVMTVESSPAMACGSPGVPYKGLANGVNHWVNLTFRVGEKVHYTCPEDHQRLIGSQIRTCHTNSRWTGRLPTCATDVIAHQPISVEIFTGYGRTAKKFNSLTDGHFSPHSSSSCLLVNDNHTFHLPSHFYHSIEFYTTDPLPKNSCTIVSSLAYHVTNKAAPAIVFQGGSFRSKSEAVVSISCTETITLCEIEAIALRQQNCGEPEVPAWSNVNITNQFKEALYTCQAGYKLEGSPRRVCEASHWSGHEPQCVPLTLYNETNNRTNELVDDDDDDDELGIGSIIFLGLTAVIGLIAIPTILFMFMEHQNRRVRQTEGVG